MKPKSLRSAVTFALATLAAGTALCFWPHVLNLLLPGATQQQEPCAEEAASRDFEDWVKDPKSGEWRLVKQPELWRALHGGN